jgi:two-component system, NarL family, sensor histidine kinase BarA
VQARPTSALDRRPALKELVDLPSFTEVCKSYVDLYGIGIKVFDADGTRLVDLRVGNGEFCGYVFTKDKGRAQCTATVRKVKDTPFDVAKIGSSASARDIESVECFTGLRYVVLPVVHEMELLGKIIFGPFLPADLDGLPKSLTDISGDFDAETANLLLGKIRRAPESTARQILDHFRMVLDVIVHTGYKAHLTSAMHIESVTDAHRELVEKNDMLQETLDKLRELDRLKSNFLATVSHELRTPLTSVIGYSEMLLDGLAGELTGEQREYVGTIMEKGENLLQLIGSILDISRIESGRVALAPAEIDVPDMIRAAVSTVLPQAQKKGLEIETVIAADLPRVHADRDKVRQCVVNLLANAVKFTPKNGRIDLEVARYTGPRREPPPGRDANPGFALFEPDENHFVRISVKDSGIGIEADQLERIFDTFYQVDSSSTREYGGTGLGLSIVKSFVDAHEGEIWVESQPGEGSRFSLLLPLARSVGDAVNAPVGKSA